MMKAKMGRKDQAEMILHERRGNSEGKLQHRPFVNAGAPSHGVMEGEDMKNANDEHVMKVDACGYAYKGYAEQAWEY
jgi:hypothetical protein